MKGWQCPKCDRVYAPHVSECGECNKAAVGGTVNQYFWTWDEIEEPNFTVPPMRHETDAIRQYLPKDPRWYRPGFRYSVRQDEAGNYVFTADPG